IGGGSSAALAICGALARSAPNSERSAARRPDLFSVFPCMSSSRCLAGMVERREEKRNRVGADLGLRVDAAHRGRPKLLQWRWLFDKLVGCDQKSLGHGETEGLGGLEIDDELVLERGLDRKLARFFALQDAICIGRRALLIDDKDRRRSGRRRRRTNRTS